MKILHVNHLLDPVSGGGTAERTFQIARFLSRLGAESAILTLDIGETEVYETQLPDVRVFKLPCLNRRYYIHLTWPWRIKHLVAQFDVMHLMGHWTMLNALVAFRCMQQGKPYVLCPAGALKPFGRSRWLKKIYDVVIGKKIVRNAKRWIAITDEEKGDLIAYGIPEEYIEVIPNGIDPEQYIKPVAAATGLPIYLNDTPFILFLGRLNAIKGPDLLLEAFIGIASQFPDMHLIFAGPDSGLLDTLNESVAKTGLEQRVHFMGYLGGQVKVDALYKATCLVIPSRNEAMSIVVLEAGICDTPVIFTDRCGLEEFAHNGAGLMVKANADSIRQGLSYALSAPDEMNVWSNRLHQQVLDRFLWSAQAKRYWNLYKKIIN